MHSGNFYKVLRVVFVACVAFIVSYDLKSQKELTISGVVVSEIDDAYLSGVLVMTDKTAPQYTDAEGKFNILVK